MESLSKMASNAGVSTTYFRPGLGGARLCGCISPSGSLRGSEGVWKPVSCHDFSGFFFCTESCKERSVWLNVG